MPKAASSKAKVSSAKRSEPIQYIYIVTQTESGPYIQTEKEVLGTYESKTEANKSVKTFARSNFADYWDRDEDEPEYPEETQDVNGCISIEAESQEGDAWEVSATRHVKTAANDAKAAAAKGNAGVAITKAKATSTAATKGKKSTPNTGASSASTAITHVYLVWKIEDGPYIENKTDVRRTYQSRDAANKYAISMARKEFSDWFVQKGEEGYDIDDLIFKEPGIFEESEVCKDGDGCISITAQDLEGEFNEIKVEKQLIYV